MTVKIDKDIPMPAKAGAGRAPKYPWHDMEIGDSFFVEKKTAPTRPQELHDQGRRFKSRQVEGGFRLWRTE